MNGARGGFQFTLFAVPALQITWTVFCIISGGSRQGVKRCTFLTPAASKLLKELRPERSAVRTSTIGFAIAALVAAVASGQSPAVTQSQNKAAYEGKALDGGADAVRVLYFTHDETPQDLQAIVNLIRATADIQRVYPYAARRAIALRGTPAQIALAEWLFSQVDKPVDPQTARVAAYEFPEPGGGVDAVRVFYFTHDETPRDLQEMMNVIRATVDVQRIFPYNARRAIALRGTPAQIALAEWLFGELDQVASPQTNRTVAYEHPAPGSGGNAVRLFFFTHDYTEEDLQEMINLIRTTTDIQRVFPHAARRAIALRGTPDQIAMAEWLFHQLGAPASEQIRPK